MNEAFFGLDIGSATLKAVELKKEGNSLLLKAFGIAPSIPGAAISGSKEVIADLGQAIKDLQKSAKIDTKKVVTAFPESSVFTRMVEIPTMSDKELATAIHWEAEQYIPVPLKEVKLDYEVLRRPREGEDKMMVLLVAVPTTAIDRYLEITNAAGLEAEAFETEIIALTRPFVSLSGLSPTTLIISIGSQTTDLCIMSKGIIAFTRSIASGGRALAKAIAQELGFEMDQAEEYKKAYGLLGDQLEGKIQEIIKPIFDVIISEIERAVLSYRSRFPTDPIKRAVLCGGTAKLPGVAVYLTNVLDFEVQIGDPWENIKKPSKAIEEKLEPDAPSFGVAVGLAMRGL
ncbi:hypothetical protein COS81_01460 [candidate division WWE3 bacterium CG06_land_8_20_14_3_00_42_16]|uniref:SHS2 domain-containing protein n=4 Tax=Katanobacteria TaxID=422282 RepID=A0A2M7ANY8_UNCKA|nr:MAG: hypothetical protein COS81_01460 [candidate division WWE3 bacterium CG06_land_8_20_14_3_00_42_16]PJA37632.1 MAG: hypothetical protein CO181_02695 [candidate division WWE3 bacterium CG_4_9_14_3_um_filter_43_9]PJC68683.1 MAG: hypothetical protein CO015_03170 [candidate division WWE3 bacterium CG_4_8_14_3_um_filter_42_11]